MRANDNAKKEYIDNFLSSLEKLRMDDLLCDVTLVVNGKSFDAHRCVLASSSMYFRKVFTGEMGDRHKTEIELNVLDAKVMKPLLEYMYTGNISINEVNARSLVAAADFLLIQTLKRIGCEFLETIICPGNCFELQYFAEQYTCDQLKTTATNFIINNFASASESEGFKVIEYNVLFDLVSRDELIVSLEEQVYEAVIAWVKHDLQSRQQYFEELFSMIRLTSISKRYLTDKVEQEELVSQSFNCTKHLLQAMRSLVVHDFEQVQKPRKVLVKHVETIVLCGGNRSRDVICYLPDLNQWSKLTESSIARDEHAVTVCDNVLYAFGTNLTENSQIVEQFNVSTNSWTMITDLPQTRCALSAVTAGEQVYVLGGRTNHLKATNSVMRYDPCINKWTYETPMNVNRAGHVAVYLDVHIYALCGINNDGEILNSVERYNTRTKTWHNCASVQSPRYYPSAAILSNKIYVVGGQGKNGSCMSSCEVYDQDSDNWSALPSLTMPRQASGICRWYNRLYVFGGCNNSGRLDTVEYYDPDSNEWCSGGHLPVARSWVQCGMLRLPIEVVRKNEI